MKNKYLYIVLIVMFLGTSSCNEENFLSEIPRNVITADNLFLTPSGFENGLNAAYALIRQERDGYGRENMRSVFAVAGTDAYYLSRFASQDIFFTQWGSYLNSTSYGLNENWIWLYQIINTANTIIDRSENESVKWSSESQKNEIVAQARCIRAWAYRHLTYCWGDVPLTLHESTGANVKTDWTRTSKAEVMKAMEEDWLFAEQYLPNVQSIPGRLNKVVAQHYLAELYLAMGDPAKAEIKALAAINNPSYALITARYGINKSKPGVPFMDQFYVENVLHKNGNTEVLWEFPYDRNINGGGSNFMRRVWLVRYSSIAGATAIMTTMGRGSDFLSVTNFGLNLYEASDDRGSEYAIHRTFKKDNGEIVTTRVGTVFEPKTDSYRPSTAKWDDGDPNDPASNYGYHDQPYLRLAETYLLLAEAQLMLSKTTQAAETLNIIRKRSNASAITASQVNIDFILDERTRELLTEEHRRYTLLRLNKWIERTKLYNHQCGSFITERDKLYPIPQPVIDANMASKMPQNTGY